MKPKTLFLSLLLVTTIASCKNTPPLTNHQGDQQQPEAVKLTPLTPGQMSHTTVRVASVQLNSPWNYGIPYDPNNCPADKVLPYIKRAGDEGPDLVVFPELFLGLFKVPSPQTEKISQAAKENNTNVIIGCFEIFDNQGHFGNSSLIFNRQGEIIGRYYKYYPAVNTPQ